MPHSIHGVYIMPGEEVENGEMESGEVVEVEEDLDHGEQEESRDDQQKYVDFVLSGLSPSFLFSPFVQLVRHGTYPWFFDCLRRQPQATA